MIAEHDNSFSQRMRRTEEFNGRLDHDADPLEFHGAAQRSAVVVMDGDGALLEPCACAELAPVRCASNVLRRATTGEDTA
jgi:hypothetical protein